MNNKVTTQEGKRVLVGPFPTTMDFKLVKTAIEEGDIIGISSVGVYGKYDEVTYTDVYGIAYGPALVDTTCSILLTGEISSAFVKIPTETKDAVILKLRKISIFIK